MGWNEQGKLTLVTVSQLPKANKLTRSEGHKYPDRDLSLGLDPTFSRTPHYFLFFQLKTWRASG